MSSPPPPTSQYKYNKLATKSFSNKCKEKSKQKKTLSVENQLRRNAFNLELKREIVAALLY